MLNTLREEVYSFLEHNEKIKIMDIYRDKSKPLSNLSNSSLPSHIISIVPTTNFRKIKNLDSFFDNLIPKKLQEEWNYKGITSHYSGAFPKNKRLYYTYEREHFSLDFNEPYINSCAGYLFEEEMARYSIDVNKKFIHKNPKFKADFKKDETKEYPIFESTWVWCYPSEKIYLAMKEIPKDKWVPELRTHKLKGNPYAGRSGSYTLLKLEDIKKYGLKV